MSSIPFPSKRKHLPFSRFLRFYRSLLRFVLDRWFDDKSEQRTEQLLCDKLSETGETGGSLFETVRLFPVYADSLAIYAKRFVCPEVVIANSYLVISAVRFLSRSAMFPTCNTRLQYDGICITFNFRFKRGQRERGEIL